MFTNLIDKNLTTLYSLLHNAVEKKWKAFKIVELQKDGDATTWWNHCICFDETKFGFDVAATFHFSFGFVMLWTKKKINGEKNNGEKLYTNKPTTNQLKGPNPISYPCELQQ